MVTQRVARWGGGIQDSGTVRIIGRWRRRGRWSEVPVEMRQRASEIWGLRAVTWSKARTQESRARAWRCRMEVGRVRSGQAEGSIRERRMRAAKDVPDGDGRRRRRMG